MFIYNVDTRYDLVEPTHTYRDGEYVLRLETECTQSEAKRDALVGECRRIMGQTGLAGYDNYSVISERDFGNSSKWNNNMYVKLTKYNTNI